MKAAQPVLGLTTGDPAEIGPELCLRALGEGPGVADDVPVWLRAALGLMRSGNEEAVQA